MAKITKIFGRQILDSRGNPTLEVELTAGKFTAMAAVPSGASTGSYEAKELRDSEKDYGGKGVLTCIKNLKTIEKHLKTLSVDAQKIIDMRMIEIDGTAQKKKLGANTILGVSLAASRVAAMGKQVPLYVYLARLAGTKPCMPLPFANVINGGKHAQGGLAFQEIMIVPTGAKSFAHATQIIAEVFMELRSQIIQKFGNALVGDEGGFCPPFTRAEEAIEFLLNAVTKSGHKKNIHLAIDSAATEFFSKGKYVLGKESLSREQLVEYYLSLVKKYPIISLEDPFAEDDKEGFAHLRKKTNIQIVGDDLLVTNVDRIKESGDLCNALLLKPNQAGTLTESIEAAQLAQKTGWSIMVSHRSGETEDPYIADLAVGIGCGQIKLGAPCRGERTAKYNQLLRIESEFKLKLKPW